MKSLSRCPRSSSVQSRVAVAPGFTLLELSIVILVLLALIVITHISGTIWKKGSDRALCVTNLEQVQKGLRGCSNMYGYNPGDSVPGMEAKVIGPGKFMEQTPVCPGGGAYTTLGDNIPPLGTLWITCSLAVGERHEPADLNGW